ncbi:hypothetical protein P9239_14685 [Caballeronia sp. LZ062]|uniref:hypothetical protein n=1 Tax=unclassified Caballeronia TaxID=2646786 RepID=UPI00285FB2DA|nr:MULTISPECIES: hypothetical protein [unclassified Caballeronia]MDR5853881.1 hypothetical protein [Caballeronia sp. LZ050]MDR5871588.1 hypothetical protein [Caballeronia sp. LZ062]
MKAPRIDLHRANRPGAAAGLAALVVGVAAVIAAMQVRDALHARGEALDDRESVVARKEAQFARISNAHRGGADARSAALMAQQRYAAEPARDLIEAGWHPNIAFLTIDIVTASRQINMQFETRSVQEAISYADWFQAQPQTESVTLKRQTEKPGPPAPSVETSLQVTWKAFGGASAGPSAQVSGAPSAPASSATASPASAPVTARVSGASSAPAPSATASPASAPVTARASGASSAPDSSATASPASAPTAAPAAAPASASPSPARHPPAPPTPAGHASGGRR